MEKAGPYAGMVTVQCAQVGLMVASKVAMSNGMTPFAFAFYSNALASLLLLPICSFLYRSSGPPILLSFLYGFFSLGFLGFLVQILGYTGLMYASATLSTSMLNLIPGFTFLFAVIFRYVPTLNNFTDMLQSIHQTFWDLFEPLKFLVNMMEKFYFRSSTTLAKFIGTVVSIIGALVITLYQGPSIINISPHSITSSQTLTTSSTWGLGGLLLAVDSVVSSLFIIAQALVLRKCPAELILMLFYSIFVAILSAAVSFIVEKDLSAWRLTDKMRLIPVIYSALFGNVFQVSIIMWCVRRRGPLFVSVFHPLGVILAIAMGIIILGESLYLGSVLGSTIVMSGFYAVMWGKAREAKEIKEDMESNGKKMPLLQN